MIARNSPEKPIGVFDSGVGGLSVLREIRRELPGEHLLYVADSGHAPYGDKPRQMIEARSVAIVEFLLNRGAKAVVVACNTATGASVETLRARFAVPIVAMEPAVKPAAESTKSGVIGVLATSGTLGSGNFARLHQRFGAKVEILVQACPGLVELVEAGDLSGDRTRALIEKYLVPLLAQQADNIVLGCTHYPFLAPLMVGRGAMTNNWVDIKNANVILVMGGNPAEAHPCGFKWVVEDRSEERRVGKE